MGRVRQKDDKKLGVSAYPRKKRGSNLIDCGLASDARKNNQRARSFSFLFFLSSY